MSRQWGIRQPGSICVIAVSEDAARVELADNSQSGAVLVSREHDNEAWAEVRDLVFECAEGDRFPDRAALVDHIQTEHVPLTI